MVQFSQFAVAAALPALLLADPATTEGDDMPVNGIINLLAEEFDDDNEAPMNFPPLPIADTPTEQRPTVKPEATEIAGGTTAVAPTTAQGARPPSQPEIVADEGIRMAENGSASTEPIDSESESTDGGDEGRLRAAGDVEESSGESEISVTSPAAEEEEETQTDDKLEDEDGSDEKQLLEGATSISGTAVAVAAVCVASAFSLP